MPYLGAAAHALSPIGAGAPGVPRHVAPLEDAEAASEVRWQLVGELVQSSGSRGARRVVLGVGTSSAGGGSFSGGPFSSSPCGPGGSSPCGPGGRSSRSSGGSSPVLSGASVADVRRCQVSQLGEDEEVSVQTGLGYWPGLGVVGTQPELEVSVVVGRQLHLHLQDLALSQLGCQHPQSVLPTELQTPWLGSIVWVTTDSTESSVLFPLSPEASTVSLMVVIIWRSFKAVSPHG